MRKVLFIIMAVLSGIPSAVRAQYRDAEVFETKGNVRMIQESRYNPYNIIRSTYSFSSAGELVSTSYGDVLSIERDSQGRLARYVYNDSGSYYQFEYDAQGRVARKFYPGGNTIYEYDENGIVIRETEDFFFVSEIEYEYLSFDDHGNWTERRFENDEEEMIRETRTILYWPENTATRQPSASAGRTVVLADQAVSGPNVRYIDERYRDMLEYVLHGTRNDYKVIIGQTKMEALEDIDDVVYSDMSVNRNGKISSLTIGSDDNMVKLNASWPDFVVYYITYTPESIPQSWKTRYGIDGNIYRDPNRRQKLAAAGFKFLGENEPSLWNYGSERYYVGGDSFSQLFQLELIIDDGELVNIRIIAMADEDGQYPQLRATASADSHSPALEETPSQPAKSKGGFLSAFDRLAEARAQKEAEAQRLREQSQKRHESAATKPVQHQSDANTATGNQISGRLAGRTLVDYPFGVLDRDVTSDEAVRQLSAHEGWMAELLDNTRIEMSADSGYDLAYDGRIPNASAQFADTDGRLVSYDYKFYFVSGTDCPYEAPIMILERMTLAFADSLATALQRQGIALTEQPEDNSSLEYVRWYYADSDRTIRINIRYCQNNSYEVTLSISMQ